MNDQPSQPCMALAVPYEWVQVAPIGRAVFCALRTDAELLDAYTRRYRAAAAEAGRMDAVPGAILNAAFLATQVDSLREIFGMEGLLA